MARKRESYRLSACFTLVMDCTRTCGMSFSSSRISTSGRRLPLSPVFSTKPILQPSSVISGSRNSETVSSFSYFLRITVMVSGIGSSSTVQGKGSLNSTS